MKPHKILSANLSAILETLPNSFLMQNVYKTITSDCFWDFIVDPGRDEPHWDAAAKFTDLVYKSLEASA